MIKLNVKSTNNIGRRLNRMKTDINNLPKETHKVVVENTAIRSGFARRNTKLRGKQIVADYGYAVKLNEGGSKQFPDGMVKPAEEFIQKRLKEIAQGK